MRLVNRARPAWVVLAALQLPLLAGWALYVLDPGKTGRRSLLIFVALAALFSLGVIGFAALWPRLRTPAGDWRLPLWARRALVAGLVAAGFAVGLVMRPEWIYAFTALNVAATAALALFTLLPDQAARPLPRWGWALLGVGAAAVVLLRVYGLAYYPYTQITDEGWLLAWPVGYLRTGHFSDYLMAYGGHDVQRYYLPMAWWLSIVGAGFWEARLFSYLVTLGVVVVGGLAGAALYDRATGWLTAFALFASAVVMIGARIRHDAGLALAIALGLWLYGLALRRHKLWLHALAGLMVGLGWFAHYHAIGFGPALALALYLPRYIAQARDGGRRRWLPEAGFWAFAAGGLLGAGAVFLLQVLPDLQAFLLTRESRTPVGLAGLLEAAWGHLQSIIFHSRYEFILIALGLGAALWRRTAIDVTLALAFLFCHLALALMAAVPWDHYPNALTPIYGLLIATLLTRGLQRAARPARLTRRTALLGLAFLLPALGLTLQIPAARLVAGAPIKPPPPPAAQWILDHVPRDARIEGEHYYYLWLHDYRYISPISPNFLPPERRAELNTLEAQWADINPDVFLLDPNLNTCCIVGPLAENGWMDDNGYRLAAEIPGQRLPVRIYVREGLLDDAE
ncbi:MAG: glycosyltransferase family 39 protein [Anaerolineae bacterium]|nr:glycosyltransferase family 39 protein [Anaerolineae bacterium]